MSDFHNNTQDSSHWNCSQWLEKCLLLTKEDGADHHIVLVNELEGEEWLFFIEEEAEEDFVAFPEFYFFRVICPRPLRGHPLYLRGSVV